MRPQFFLTVAVLFAAGIPLCLPAIGQERPKRPPLEGEANPAPAARPDRPSQRPQNTQRMQNAQRQQMQRAQAQRGQAGNLYSLRLLSTPPELLKKAGASDSDIEALVKLRGGLRNEFGSLMQAMREADEDFRSTMRDPDATKEDALEKLKATSKAQLALREKDVDMIFKVREQLGLETLGKLHRAQAQRSTDMRDRMTNGRMTDRARPGAESDRAPDPKRAPWLRDQGDRIKKEK